MAKKRTVYVCDDCGAEHPRWAGQCAACSQWNSLKMLRVDPKEARKTVEQAELPVGNRALSLAEIRSDAGQRVPLSIGELDRVLGGGLVPGAVALLGGEPGIGKSTLILQAAAAMAEVLGPVLYVSGEESTQQIKARAERLGLDAGSLYLFSENSLDQILGEIDRLGPRAIIVDSIQTVHLEDVGSAAGSVTQVRECGARISRLAKDRGIPVFLIGHVTKRGDIAGPRILEHMVDMVLQLEGDRHHSYRLLRGVKNRYGSTNEVGVFEMRASGMMEIENPSKAFLAERLAGTPGSAVTVTLEGTRPILVEVQALVSQAGGQGPPRRMASGIELNRLLLMAAVLSKRFGLPLGNQDIFVNVVGGLRIQEPAVDLAVAVAICSSVRAVPIAPDHVLFGEVGLSGELRSVGQVERRLIEAVKLGFPRAVLPTTSLSDGIQPDGMDARGVRTLGEAVDAVLPGNGGRAEG